MLALGALGVLAAVSATGCGNATGSRSGTTAPDGTYTALTSLVQFGALDKVDLLFVIDNSASMADKQQILGESIGDLINQFANPPCIDTSTFPTEVHDPPAHPFDACPPNLVRSHPPIFDLHVGTITTSLGGRGADSCSPSSPDFNFTQNDGARLVARDASGGPVDTHGDLGFLAWDPFETAESPGETDLPDFGDRFRQMLLGAGERGCGFEAPLEAWYRFLVDPDPYERVERVPCFDGDTDNGCAARTGTDDVLLEQRREFLRPDSLLVIVMLTDENDCSIVDDGQFFLSLQLTDDSGQLFHLPRATDVCATDPDDPCCYSCGQAPPAGCAPPSASPSCNISGGFYDDASGEDQINLRCFDQKRRFGIDFLQPVDRYVRGLRELTVPDRSGDLVPNPVFSNIQGTDAPTRNQGLVFLAGIVGIPWQLIDDEAASSADTLEYLSAEEIRNEGLWDAIVGACPGEEVDGRCDVRREDPTEPLMRETFHERVGVPPGPTGEATHPSVAPWPDSNAINGHEWNISGRDDLQYACIFPLPSPRPLGSDCVNDPTGKLKPLCQDPATGAYGDTQFFAKAYPATRQLEVLKGLGDSALVASICARNVDDPSRSDFGYRAALGAITNRLKTTATDRCLPTRIPLDDAGAAPCRVFDVTRRRGDCDCGPNRAPVSAAQERAVHRELAQAGQCAMESSNCDDLFCTCELPQASGDARVACQSEPGIIAGLGQGWCIIDPEQGIGNEALVARCPRSSPRDLRFFGPPDGPGTMRIISCVARDDIAGRLEGDPGRIGDTCIPSLETRPEFSGFAADAHGVEIGSTMCRTEVCLVDGLEGRVSCPYGQFEDELSLPPDDPARCRTPVDGEPVTIAVDPQRSGATADERVYCSCRCDGPDGTGPFCRCPKGFFCEEIIPNVEAPFTEGMVGSYCVKDPPSMDTFFGAPCQKYSPESSPDNCGNNEDVPQCGAERCGVNP